MESYAEEVQLEDQELLDYPIEFTTSNRLKRGQLVNYEPVTVQQLEAQVARRQASLDDLRYYQAFAVLGDCSEYAFNIAETELQEIVKGFPSGHPGLNAFAICLHLPTVHELQEHGDLYFKSLTQIRKDGTSRVPYAVYQILAFVEQAVVDRLAACGISVRPTAIRNIYRDLQLLVDHEDRFAHPVRMFVPFPKGRLPLLGALPHIEDQLESDNFGFLSPAARAFLKALLKFLASLTENPCPMVQVSKL